MKIIYNKISKEDLLGLLNLYKKHYLTIDTKEIKLLNGIITIGFDTIKKNAITITFENMLHTAFKRGTFEGNFTRLEFEDSLDEIIDEIYEIHEAYCEEISPKVNISIYRS